MVGIYIASWVLFGGISMAYYAGRIDMAEEDGVGLCLLGLVGGPLPLLLILAYRLGSWQRHSK